MKTNMKKAVAFGVAGLVVGGFGGAMLVEPEVITETNIIYENVTVPMEIEVDNGNLDFVLEHIYDNDGQVNYLLEDLDDDELDLIVERIIFINDIKFIAGEYVATELADELDNLEFTLADGTIVTFDEDDIERVKVYDDDDELIIDYVDFEDSDAKVLVTARFEQDDIDYEVDFEVEFRDGEVDDIDVLEIRERD